MTPEALPAPARRWRGPTVALAAAALIVAAFWWTGRWAWTRWMLEGSYYSHGWLVCAVSVGLLWTRRQRLASAPLRPSAWGLALLVPALGMHVLASAWQVGFLSGFALLAVLAGAVWAVFGRAVLGICLFPIAFLAFAVPLPEVLITKASFRLKLLAAQVATVALDALGLVAVRSGSYIRIPTGTVIVDDVCSGLKYLISLLAFGALYAHISPLGTRGRLALFGLAVPVSFVANVVRVILMVLVAYRWGVDTSEEWYFHDLFGFVLFAVAFVMLFVIEAFMLGETRGQHRAHAEGEPAGAEGADPAPTGMGLVWRPAVHGATLLVLALAAGLALRASTVGAEAAAIDLASRVPRRVGPWQGVEHTLSDRDYALLGTRNVLSRTYTDDMGRSVVFVVVAADHVRRRTHPPEQCFAGEGYAIAASASRTLDAAPPGGLRVRELLLRSPRQTRLAWYFFKSGDHFSTSYWAHQAGLALRKLSDPEASDVLVRIDAEADPADPAPARGVLSAFARDVLPHVLAGLP